MPYYENAIKRIFKKLKLLIKYNNKIKEDIENLQDRIEKIKWTDNTREERLRLYQHLGSVIQLYRDNRIKIRFLQREFLETNITG